MNTISENISVMSATFGKVAQTSTPATNPASSSVSSAAATSAPASPAPEIFGSSTNGQESTNTIDDAVGNINSFIAKAAPGIEFSIDEESGRAIVSIIDRETDMIIRQVPTAEALAISKTLDRLQGLLIRQFA